MNYLDRIYGNFELDEPVLVKLIQSNAIQRLQGILQHGITGMIGICSMSTRFEHSVGVMRLVQKMGGSLKEQIAALVHDVSHTAFSHVIDHVFKQAETQSFHEERKEWFFQQSDIPDILNQYGYQWQEFLDEDQFSILEQPAPALCADRVDYLFRDTADLNLLNTKQIQSIISNLDIFKGRIVCKNIKTARLMADVYLKADEKSWSNFREVGLYEITAQTIQRARDIHLIRDEDLWNTDLWLLDRLKSSKDILLHKLLKMISIDTKFKWNEANPTFVVKTKVRVIDPDIKQQNSIAKLSVLDFNFKNRLDQYILERKKPLPICVLKYPTT